MKVTKGSAGYLYQKKKKELMKTILEFGIVAALFVTGYVTTKTRLNLLTLVAVLGCLPASKALVGIIMLAPRKSLEEEKVKEKRAAKKAEEEKFESKRAKRQTEKEKNANVSGNEDIDIIEGKTKTINKAVNYNSSTINIGSNFNSYS